MTSISDSQRSVGGQNLGFYQKHRSMQARVGQGYPLHIRMAQALQSPEHIYYGKYLASEPPSGLRQVNQTGFGLFNGGGFLPPPPRPGARLVTGEVGQSMSVRLGEIFQHGGNDEVGEGALQLGTDLPVVSSPWLAPAAVSMDGLTFISYIPKPDNEGTQLNLEMPANQMFFANQTATNYHVSVGTDVIAENQTVTQNTGAFSTTTNRLMGEIALREAVTNYNHIYDGTLGINLLDGSTEVNEIQASPADSGWVNVLEQLIELPILNEKYREVVYCLLQNLAADAWSGTTDNPVAGLVQNLTQEAGLGGVVDVMAKLNKWLPEALKIKDLLFGKSDQRATVGVTTLDLKTLDLTLDISQGIAKINEALAEEAFVYTANRITVCGFEITTNDTYSEIPSTLVQCLKGLNNRLPASLKFETYGSDRVTALRITPGLFISEGKALVVETTIGNPVTIAIDALRCTLPIELQQLAQLEYGDQTITSKPFSVEQLIAKIQMAVGLVENPEAALQILTNYLPAELKGVFSLDGNSVFINPEAIYNFGVAELNKKLPSQLQLGISSEDGKISGVTLGPLSAKIDGGNLTLGLDLAKTVGGLNIQGVLDFLPDGLIQDFLASTTFEVALPYDQLEPSESEDETLNRGGYLGEWPELNLSETRQGSPIPLLLSTLECLSAFGEDASISPSIPAAEQYQIPSFDVSCHASSIKKDGYLDVGKIPIQNKENFNIADFSEWPSNLVGAITTNPISPSLPNPIYDTSTSKNPLEAFLESYGIPAQVAKQVRAVKDNQSVTSVLKAVGATAPLSFQLATSSTLETMGVNDREFVRSVSGCSPEIVERITELPLTEAMSTLLYTPLDTTKLIENPLELVSWIENNEPTLTKSTEHLMFGELPEFFTQLIYLKTGEWLPAHPKAYERMVRLIKQEFGYRQ